MAFVPVRVALRCRPFVNREERDGCQPCLYFSPGEPQVILKSKKLQFTFDHTFLEDAKQEEVFTKCVFPMIENVFEGYNVTVMAYGQSGSGKTYTMGTSSLPNISNDLERVGIIPRAIKAIFDGMGQRKSADFQVTVSFLEIYNEDLIDLLKYSKSINKNVGIREDTTGAKVFGISEHKVNNCDDVLACLERGNSMRTTGTTAISHSSRSHAIFTLSIESKHSEDEETFVSKFNFVDIGGFARAKKAKTEGEHLKEGININLGLLALGKVIRALSEGGNRNHVPYRESKLTRLLQDSLGGNSYAVMIACVGPGDYNLEETLNTLQYAHRVKKIKNKPVVNQNPQAMEIAGLRLLVQHLQEQLVSRDSDGNESNNPIASSSQLESARKQIIDLESENEHLRKKLQNAVDQRDPYYERAETGLDKVKQKLEELRQKTFDDGLEGSENTKLKENIQKSAVNYVKEMIMKLETQNFTAIANLNTISNVANSSLVLNKETYNEAIQHADNGNQFGFLKEQNEHNVKELEKEVAELRLEKEKLSQTLRMAATNSNNVITHKEQTFENAENLRQVRAKKKKSDDKGCGCRTACTTRRCKCFKLDKRCDSSCNCTDLCRN